MPQASVLSAWGTLLDGGKIYLQAAEQGLTCTVMVLLGNKQEKAVQDAFLASESE
jgi:hypothetical protein